MSVSTAAVLPAYDLPPVLSVLIVDDSEADANLFRHFISEIGEVEIDLHQRYSYSDGLEALRSGAYDIAFIDYRLGPQSGADLIVEAGGETSATPLILLTGQFGWRVERQGIEAGAAGFIEKDALSPQLLRQAISYARHKHYMVRDLAFDLENYRDLAYAAAEAEERKSQFFAEMSHELRTPLNAISGFAEVLKDQVFGDIRGEAAERYLQYANDIYISSQHLLSLVNDLLDISKFEAGKYELRFGEFTFGGLFQDIEMMTALEADAKDVTVNTDLSSDLPRAKLDRRLILQAVLNVVTNAIRFTEPGGTVDIKAETIDDFFCITIEDNGVGIAAEDISYVMLPYRRGGDSQKTRPGGGTGLGLTLTRSIIELHGGRISIESEPGKGTKVTIRLPPEAKSPSRAA